MDPLGLQEEDEGRLEEPSLQESMAEAQVNALVRLIKEFKPDYQYRTYGSPGSRYGTQDVRNLQRALQDAEL